MRAEPRLNNSQREPSALSPRVQIWIRPVVEFLNLSNLRNLWKNRDAVANTTSDFGVSPNFCLARENRDLTNPGT